MGAEYFQAAPVDAMLQGPLQFCCLTSFVLLKVAGKWEKMYPRRPVQSSSRMSVSCTKRWKLVIGMGCKPIYVRCVHINELFFGLWGRDHSVKLLMGGVPVLRSDGECTTLGVPTCACRGKVSGYPLGRFL